jgi:nucleoside-triphosphatase
MSPAFLLTGLPGSGKTTAIRKILSDLPYEAGGFYTQEIRERGRRVGFKIITLDGRQGVLAHVGISGSPRIGKYGVDISLMDSLGVDCLQEALEARKVVVIDEIGPMELLSARFREIVLQILDRDVLLLGSIVRRSMAFSDMIKARADVTLIEVNRGNRQQVADRVLAMIRSSYRLSEQGPNNHQA